jgi:trehalose 6-phosphate phosphatase
MQRYPVDHAVQQACVLATQVLTVHPSGLVTDLDGTISPIASAPEQARVLPGCRRALEGLRERLDLVAVVSGRRGAEARKLVDVEGVVYLGNHGLDPWIGGNSSAPAAGRTGDSSRANLEQALDELREDVAGQPGLRLEDKGATVSIHYRAASDADAARELALAAATRAAARHSLAVAEGKKVVELRPGDWAGKGTAVERLVLAYGLRGLVYLGDDHADLHAFETLGRLREADGLLTLSIGVVGAEVPAELTERADIALAGPEQVEAFLENLVEGLRGTTGDKAG